MRPKKKPLVCQFIENLGSQALERYADTIRKIVGRRHGVYALYRKGRLYYVGLASNLRGRIHNHVKDRHAGKWDSFSVYLTIDNAHMRELESLLIRIASPKGNKQRGRFARAENLMKTLKADVRSKFRSEIRSLGLRVKEPDSTAAQPRSRRRKRGEPTLASYVTRSFRLRGMHNTVACKARVLKDGRVRVGSKSFNSPTMAARHFTGYAVSGLDFWKYERAPGQWVKLRELQRG